VTPREKGLARIFHRNEQTFSRFVMNSLDALTPQMVYGYTITRRFSRHLVQEWPHLSARRERESRTLCGILGGEDFGARMQVQLPAIERLDEMPQVNAAGAPSVASVCRGIRRQADGQSGGEG
jgi:hypothetical protein